MRLPRELVFVGALFTKRAHGATRFVRVFEAVEHHVVVNTVVADADAAAAFQQQMRRIGHALHAAGDHHVAAASDQLIVGEQRRFHARTAHLGQRHRTRAGRQAALETGLPRRRLALPGHQAIAEQHFVNEGR